MTNNEENEEFPNNEKEFEETHKIEETYLYKEANKNNGDILNESDAEIISKIRSNKKKHKKKKKKKTRKNCKNKKNNNDDNGNNNNGYLIKIEESENARQTLGKQETDITNKKENNYLSNNNQKFSGSYLDYLDNDGFSANLSQKSTNNSERQVSEYKSKQIICIKRTNSFFNPNQKEFSLFPIFENENKYFDSSRTLEMEKKIKEYDKNEIENIIENEEEINSYFAPLNLDDVINKCTEMKSKTDEQNINFTECKYAKTEFYDSDKRNSGLLGKRKKRKNK